MPRTYKIKRDPKRAFFSRRRTNSGRYVYLMLMALLIAGLPALALTQYDRMQLAVLDAVGMAPTATPFASVRADDGMQLFKAGNIEAAADYLRMATEQQPNNVDYLYEYGLILLELDERDQAERIGDRVIQLAPNDPRGYSLKATSMVWSDPGDAIPIAVAGLERNAEFAPLHAALAIAYTNIQRYQEALARGRLAIQLDPVSASARRSYSFPLIYTGQYSEAINQLEQAIAINPNLTPPYFELASLYRIIDQPEMAVAIYNRVLELNPLSARAYHRLCETYAEVGQFQDGQIYCEEALEIDPFYASAHKTLGQIQYSRRNYEGAIESFERCVEYGSNDIECYYIRGFAHYFLNECDTAWSVLAEARQRPDVAPQILDQIDFRLQSVINNCAGYQNRSLPTAVPPTPIPPTPIGGG